MFHIMTLQSLSYLFTLRIFPSIKISGDRFRPQATFSCLILFEHVPNRLPDSDVMNRDKMYRSEK